MSPTLDLTVSSQIKKETERRNENSDSDSDIESDSDEEYEYEYFEGAAPGFLGGLGLGAAKMG